MKDLTWYQYLLHRVPRHFCLHPASSFCPFGLNADWDFPIFAYHLRSRRHLRVDCAAGPGGRAPWHYRRRFPLASYGFLAFLVLMAPTSSILPIRDPIAERRLYFAMLGLLLVRRICCARVKLPRATLAGGVARRFCCSRPSSRTRAPRFGPATSRCGRMRRRNRRTSRAPTSNWRTPTLDAGDCARAAARIREDGADPRDGYTRYNLLVDWGWRSIAPASRMPALAKFRRGRGDWSRPRTCIRKSPWSTASSSWNEL